MNLGAIKSGAILAGAAIGGGSLVGAGVGAVQSLKGEPDPAAAGLTVSEKRGVLANAIIGAGVGALGGVALIGAKKVINIPALKGLPMVAMLGLGTATGAASYGAYSLGRTIAN